MIEDNFLNLYMSKNHLILEGYAYAISASWYYLLSILGINNFRDSYKIHQELMFLNLVKLKMLKSKKIMWICFHYFPNIQFLNQKTFNNK